MLPQDLKPNWSRRDAHLLLDYEVRHRIYDASIYPLKSPNGSQILLFGHQQGLTVIWKGGSRTFNPETSSNGEDESDVFADSEKEDTSMMDQDLDAPYVPEDDYDLSDSIDQIVDVYNFFSESPVVHIAFAPIPSNRSYHVVNSIPSLFSNSMVIALAYLDGSLRLVTLPLLPPALAPGHDKTQTPTIPNSSELVIISERSAMQQKCRGLALTWTSPGAMVANSSEIGHQWDISTSDNSQSQISKNSRRWSLLIAAHNAEAASSLSIYEVPLPGAGDSLDTSQRNFKPCQKEHLPGLVNAISFSPERFPSYRHSELLVADITGSVRIYDCIPSAAHHSISTMQELRSGRLPGRGAWLATFYTNYMDGDHDRLSLPKRKRILSVDWALNGRCVMALLEDGEWGIWDIEGAGPTPSRVFTEKKIAGQKATLTGGGITGFALHGFIGSAGGNSVDRDGYEAIKQPLRETLNREQRKLAPMTPKTRRAKQETLFAGKPANEVSKTQSRGGISLSQHAPSVEGGVTRDESLLIWFGGSIFYTPSLLSYWQKAVNRSGGPSGPSKSGGILGSTFSRLGFLPTHGEQITTVCQPMGRTRSATHTPEPDHDVLLVAEHRFILLSPVIQAPRPRREPKLLPARGRADENAQSLRLLEQDLLSRGELSLGGLDMLIDGLDQQRSNNPNTRPGPGKQPRHAKNVGFAALD